MKVGVLYSGGKDSSLAAVLLSRDYDVELMTFVFNENHAVPSIEAAAKETGFPWKKLVFVPGFLDEVVDQMQSMKSTDGPSVLQHRNMRWSLTEPDEMTGFRCGHSLKCKVLR